jgi:flagellin
LGDKERAFIAEIRMTALGKDINEVANQTVFQDYALLNGSGGTDNARTGSLGLTFQVGERAADVITTDLQSVNVTRLFAENDNASSAGRNIGATTGAGGAQAGGAAISVSNLSAATQGGALSFATGTNGANSADFRAFLSTVDTAIERMAERVNDIGVTQSSLSIREVTLSQSISANSSAASRIMDTDFAREQSNSIRLQILQQTATSALAQANSGPQSVLGFLR